MQRQSHYKQRIMFQFPPDMPTDERLVVLSEEYRNLYDRVEKLEALVDSHDAVING